MRVVLLAILSSLLTYPTGATASAAELSPVSRVVELLKGLSKQIEEEGKKEEDLYETYVCWAKSVIEQKTNSNTAAASRIDMLETYIADLESGRIELTSERADLEKEVEELMGDLEVAKSTREKENADFLDAEDEMKKAIKALNSAIEVLGEATKNHTKGVLIAMRARLNNGGMAALAEQQAALTHAVALGNRFLEKADSTFLNHLLLGDVPTVDWKKLNRKATFKMAYKARSFKIQSVLKKLHQTFDINLKDATKKEADAKASYDKLSKAKQDQLDAAREALTKMESENGAKGMSKQDSKDEVAALKKQVKSDEEFISQTTAALAKKKEEWKARQTLRAGELEAISKAVYILHNDDARDNFKKSFASQGFFLQTEMVAKRAQAASGAAAALRKAAQLSGDSQLLALAASLSGPSVKTKFGPVVDAIDKMIAILKGNEKKDLETKETCEEDRMDDTRKAVLAGRAIDEMTDKMTQLAQEIKVLGEEIEKLLAEHKKVKEELDAATKIRKDENAAWKITNKEDEEAAATVKSASAVIKKFYADNNLVLAQKGQQPEVTAGEAPPPPPATWEGGYGGKTGESMGIVSMLDMIHEDIIKDQTTAKAEEDASQKEYDTFKKESEDQMKDLMDDKNAKDGTKGKKEGELEDTKKSRGTKKGDLDALMEKMEKINPNCEYFMVNYPLRLKNRQIELDGLEKAKAILQGGVFDKGPDPSREIKPGDAANFLQIRRH